MMHGYLQNMYHMHFELAYLIVIGLLFLVGIFYLSPFELKINNDDDEE